MRIFLFIALFFVYSFAMKKFSSLVSKTMKLKSFKKMTFMAPFDLLLSIILIKIIGLSFVQAGISLGDTTAGLKSFLMLGVPAIIINTLLVFTIPKEQLNETNYAEDGIKWTMIFVLIFVGPVEELFYRGFVQGTLATMINGQLFMFSYAAIIGSLIFTLVHINNVFKGDETLKAFLIMFPIRFLLGLILGYSFQVSESLIFPIIIHNLIDTCSMSAIYFRKKSIKSTLS